MNKEKVIVGIDPDVDGSGVAVVVVDTRKAAIYQYGLPALVEKLLEIKNAAEGKGLPMVVVVEASYLISTNWHLDWEDSQRRAAAKGRQVGRNHEIGRQIVEFCKYYAIPCEEKLPLIKSWAGKDGKITHDELNMLLEGMGFETFKQSNQEKRDAALLALDRSGLPLIMAPKKKKQR